MENTKPNSSSFWSNNFNKKIKHSDLTEILLEIPVFSGLQLPAIKEIVSLLHQRQFAPNEYIFKKGAPGIGLYIITEGEVQIEISNDAEHPIIMAEFSKGDFFGELALLDGETRSGSAKAKTEVMASVLFKPDLDHLIAKRPKDGIAILNGFSKTLASRLRNLNEEYYQLYNENQKYKEKKNG